MTYIGEEEKNRPYDVIDDVTEKRLDGKFYFFLKFQSLPSLQNSINQKLYIFLILKMIPDSRDCVIVYLEIMVCFIIVLRTGKSSYVASAYCVFRNDHVLLSYRVLCIGK